AALEDGMSPDTKVASPDRLKLPNTVTYLPNSTDCGGSETTLSNALRVSCNTAFANVGLEVGQDKLREQAQKFGFNARHLADLNGVASQFPDDMDRAQLALSSIGQFDVAASPLQMAMVTAAIANDGALMDPYVVARVQRPDLKPLSTTKPAKLSQAMSAANAKELQEMMRIVVAEGTGSNAAISGVEVGGKTGTAQSDPSRKPFAWFTSFAPVENPEVAVAVIVEDADIPRQDIAGGRLAAPIARATMQAALS
ncbi:MAG: penicillin-binding protein 2, partial [Microlunatus sp.]|nr:penicillin-binding protein 2 [Microlunatus sp.]